MRNPAFCFNGITTFLLCSALIQTHVEGFRVKRNSAVSILTGTLHKNHTQVLLFKMFTWMFGFFDSEAEEEERATYHPVSGQQRKAAFSYAEEDAWATTFPNCSGRRQSPINIELSDVQIVKAKNVFTRAYYTTLPTSMTITNNGHTLQITGTWQNGKWPYITGGPLFDKYMFAQMHFHWSTTGEGSEHTIANRSYAMEIHMVHYKKSYGNVAEAIKRPDGLAVLGIFLGIDSKNGNLGLEMMTPVMGNLVTPGSSVKMTPFPLSLFNMNMAKDGYITYLGSLTTPPCSESVIWLVGVEVKDASTKQHDAIRHVKLEGNDKENVRQLQPVNGRTITYHRESRY